MIVQCPNCTTKFKFPDDKVKSGVKVRCSKCKNVFELDIDASGAQAPAPGPTAAPTPPPPKPAPAPAAPDEKFNFGDDIDFSDKQEESTERKPTTPAQKDYATGVGDIKISEDEPRAAPPPRREPAPAPAPPKPREPAEESEEFSFEDEADFSTEEFGSQPKPAKDADMGFSSEMPEIPGGDPKAVAAPEPDFDEGMADFKIDRGEEIASKPPGKSGKKESDMGSDEEFDFGGKLESYARTDTIKSKGAGSDDLEAQLDVDTDGAAPGPAAAATSAQVREAKPAPSRPAAMARPAPKGGGLKYLIIFGVVVVLALGGALAFFNSKGSFTFSDLGKGKFGKLKTVPEIEKLLVAIGLVKPEIRGSVEIIKDSLQVFNVERNEGGVVLVVQGRVRNDYPASVRFVQVQVNLYDAAKAILASGVSYCDVNFSRSELAGMSQSEIQGYMDTKAGKNMNNLEIKPGEERDFSAVFFSPPKGVESFDPKVLNSYELIK